MKLGLGLSLPGVAAMGNKSALRLILPGTSGSFASTPDSAALNITGDLELRALVAATDWTPSALSLIGGKYGGANTTRTYGFGLQTTGTLWFTYSNGSLTRNLFSSVAPTVADAAELWLRVTHDVDNGAGGGSVQFFTGPADTDDHTAVTWTQLGTTQTVAAVETRSSSSVQVTIGAGSAGGNLFTGSVRRFVILNGIGGTVVGNMRPADYNGGTTFTSATTGEVYTLNGAATIGR